jgi:triosephosphate isomerase (TIM)
MKKLVVANWKMNPGTMPEAERLFAGIAKLEIPNGVEAVICPPYPYLAAAKMGMGKEVALGAQDVFWEEGGAFTGEVSARMLKHLGVKYVIAGHSERRHFRHETDEEIAEKVNAILEGDLRVILCVGEPADVRHQGREAAKKFVLGQLSSYFSLTPEQVKNFVIAYEPVWAISTNGLAEEDSPEDAADMIKHIKEFMSLRGGDSPRVLYGGSVSSNNIAYFMEQPMIDGVLVGHASLDPKEFKKIIDAAA